jgi:hypothetical protein
MKKEKTRITGERAWARPMKEIRNWVPDIKHPRRALEGQGAGINQQDGLGRDQ